jgi:hypothetical protein
MGFPGEESEFESRKVFLDLLQGMLQLDPVKIVSAPVARNHPFFGLKL